MKFARIAAAALALAAVATAAETNYLFIPGIQGSATARGFENSIPVLTVSQGLTNAGSAHIGSGAGAGAADVRNLVVTMNLDKSWAPLLNAGFTGTNLKSLEIRTVAQAANGTSTVVRRIVLTNVFVTAVEQSTVEKNGVPDHDVLTVAFSFQSIQWNWAQPAITYTANISPKS